MEWDDFRYVLAIGRTGSLSGAAETLGVVRTTVGRRLLSIETMLGVRLFERRPEGFVPTEAGQDLVEVAINVESQICAAKSRVLGGDAQLEGPLRVSTLGFVYASFTDVFSAFMERYPKVALTLSATDEQVSLRRGEADVALRLNNEPPDHLFGRKIGIVEFALYASRLLVERVGSDAGIEDFPWLRGVDGGLDAWMEDKVPGAKIAMEFESYAILRASLSAGVGVHFLPCFDGENDSDLVALGPRLSDESRALWVLTLPELRSNSRVRAFMEHVHLGICGRI